MSGIENMLHVLRMPVPDNTPTPVTRLEFATLLVVVVLTGAAILLGFHKWL